jgi:hypothetical protein
VAVLGSTAGLPGLVVCDVVAVGPTVVFVEIFANGWAAVIVVSVAIVAPIAVAVDVALVVVIPAGGEFKAKGCDVCSCSVEFGVGAGKLGRQSTIGAGQV